MYIKTRVFTAVYRLSVCALSAFATWLLFHLFGNEAWRLYPTWIMLIAAAYYALQVLVILFSRRRDPGRVVCPPLQGAIIVSGVILVTFRLVFSSVGLQVVGLEKTGMVLTDIILPVLFLLDWILFTKKGRWRVIDPFYWLALPVCYAMWILLSAEFMNANAALRYPYAFLDFRSTGLEIMLSWFALMAVIILAIGYVCVVIDFVMSGNLAKHIVLPRIKTIVIEEEIELPAPQPKTTKAKKPATKASRPAAVVAKSPGNPLAKSTAKASDKPATKSGEKTATKATPKSTEKPKPKPKSKKPVALLEAQARSTKTPKK